VDGRQRYRHSWNKILGKPRFIVGCSDIDDDKIQKLSKKKVILMCVITRCHITEDNNLKPSIWQLSLQRKCLIYVVDYLQTLKSCINFCLSPAICSRAACLKDKRNNLPSNQLPQITWYISADRQPCDEGRLVLARLQQSVLD
jgi:hypothetical protein